MTVPPSLAVAGILALPLWIMTDGLRPLVHRFAWHPIAMRLAPILCGVLLCLTPGLLDTILYSWLGYGPLGYVSAWAYGVTAGCFATTIHALGLRQGLTAALAGRLRRLLPPGEDGPR